MKNYAAQYYFKGTLQGFILLLHCWAGLILFLLLWVFGCLLEFAFLCMLLCVWLYACNSACGHYAWLPAGLKPGVRRRDAYDDTIAFAHAACII